ncbi:hypothetical protein VNO80_10123 [Phaseolus coccineus]|uniref:Uncharacterized protein n=1 Tax=Phaseolus coccineus TaxID=3886 RepID=A0AAN9N838_PHACN
MCQLYSSIFTIAALRRKLKRTLVVEQAAEAKKLDSGCDVNDSVVSLLELIEATVCCRDDFRKTFKEVNPYSKDVKRDQTGSDKEDVAKEVEEELTDEV